MNTADDNLVYIDPDTRTVIGPVEWDGDDPKKLPREQRGYYPYCTLRTAEHVLWKKRHKQEEEKLSLDDALQKAIMEPFWD